MSFVEDLRSAVNLDDALARIIAHFKAESGTVHLLEPDGMLHLKAASKGLPEAVLSLVRVVPVGKGMAGLAVQRCEPITICNIQTDTSGDVRPGAKKTGMEGAIVVPIMRGDAVVGALGIANRNERTFTDEEQRSLTGCGRAIAALGR